MEKKINSHLYKSLTNCYSKIFRRFLGVTYIYMCIYPSTQFSFFFFYCFLMVFTTHSLGSYVLYMGEQLHSFCTAGGWVVESGWLQCTFNVHRIKLHQFFFSFYQLQINLQKRLPLCKLFKWRRGYMKKVRLWNLIFGCMQWRIFRYYEAWMMTHTWKYWNWSKFSLRFYFKIA